MTPIVRRRLTVTDGLVLVASTAAGLGFARWVSRAREATFGTEHDFWWPVVEADHPACVWPGRVG